MPVERSAGIIIFRNIDQGRKYLVIRASRDDKNKPVFWDFPKGLLGKGESGVAAALRETEEETGLADLKIIQGFKETVRYFTRHNEKTALKFVAMFLAESKSEDIKLSWEHDAFEWLPYEKARERITRKEMKRALDKAKSFLA